MADTVDIASERQEINLNKSIEEARASLTKPKINPIGVCLYCAVKLDKGLRFCDKDCAADAEKYGTFFGTSLDNN